MTAPVTPLLPLNEDMNARRWAQDFIERWKGYTVGDSTVDEGLMIAWFANAIMCGFDNGYRKSATSEIDPKESAAPQDGAHEKQHGDTAPAVAAPDDKNGEELPGMLAVAKGIAERRWPHTMDARAWAVEFNKAFAENHEGCELDVGWLICWFANAIMAGYDTAQSRHQSATHTSLLEECLRELRRWRSCQSIGACRNCADDGVILRVQQALADRGDDRG